MAARLVTEAEFEELIGQLCVDLISNQVGGEIIGVSDEFFAKAENLINIHAPIFKPGYFVETGKWYDGWETKRHNADADWVVIKFGVACGTVAGFEVDTAFFVGNHAPEVSVEVCYSETPLDLATAEWTMLSGRVDCGPSSRHFYVLDKPTTESFNYVRLKQYPDGGISRFRLYGNPLPDLSHEPSGALIDLASVHNGGLVVACSDQHFGKRTFLNLPGRGHDMSDGWETARSRSPGHSDWAILRLGAPGTIDSFIIDTANFLGNYPESVQVEGIVSDKPVPDSSDAGWTLCLSRQKLGPGKIHEFPAENSSVFSHIRMTIFPDGKLKPWLPCF